MKEQRLKELFHRYVNRTSTEQEDKELMYLLADKDLTEKAKDFIDSVYDQESSSHKMNSIQAENILAEILGQSKPEQAIVKRIGINWKRWMAAASVILVAGLGIYFISSNGTENNTQIANLPALENDVNAPGMNKAMITLADGSTVSLESVSSGLLAQQGNVKLVKLADGQIVYQAASGEVIKELQYNTLVNPRGSKVVDMSLADGSHVWLNAGSSITFPVVFAGNERKVSIDGEAYFEVAHNADAPFIVKKGTAEVLVLGTHFNVNAYDDEADIKVTLLQGSVKVNNGSSSVVIKPNQQAQITDVIKIVDNAEVDEVMAWKNGQFNFTSQDIQTIMRQISIWYDVDISYEGNISKELFSGIVSRTGNLMQVLKIFKEGGIKFSVQGKRVIVLQ